MTKPRLTLLLVLLHQALLAGTQKSVPADFPGKALERKTIEIVGVHGYTDCKPTSTAMQNSENPNRTRDYQCSRGLSPQFYLNRGKKTWLLRGVSIAVNSDLGPRLALPVAIKIRDEVADAFKSEYHLHCQNKDLRGGDEHSECSSEQWPNKIHFYMVSYDELRKSSLGGDPRATPDIRISVHIDH